MPELVDLEKYLEELDRIIAEFDAKIAEIQIQIDSLGIEIATVEGQISLLYSEVDNLQSQVDIWQQREKTAEFLYNALVQKWLIDSACNDFNTAWSGYAQVEHLAMPGLPSVRIWMPPGHQLIFSAISIQVKSILVSEANKQFATAQTNLNQGRNALSAAQNTLEAKTRHMRDLQLAKEAAEEEKRGALALWEAEYEATKERKRIEIQSIARDLALGYPTMDAETARNIAEMAYSEALARGFTRLADAIRIATDLADEWADKPVIPHYTTRTIFCPACGIKLEITSSDIETDNRDLSCPQCGASVGRGIQVRVIEYIPPTPPPIAGAWDWLRKYAPWAGVAALGTVTIYAALKKR